jgi:hypothetical protein
MSSKGYIVIAQNSGSVDYLQQAYALALNLKLTQSTISNLTVCVDEETKKQITQKHKDIFDHIIEIPWEDNARGQEWKIHNKWKYYYMTPYDETVILDTDMIFPKDISFWWDHLSERDIWACTNVLTYRNELIDDNYYRIHLKRNKMPNVYTAFFYFKKCDLSTEFFKMVQIIFDNWERFYFKYMSEGKPDWVSADVVYSLAMKILGIESLCTMDHIKELPTFIHMKSYVQNIPTSSIDEDWTKSIPTYYKNHTDFKVGNFQILYPFHYVTKDWMTKYKISKMEAEYYGSH